MQKAIKQKNKKTLNGNEPNLQKNMSSGKLFEVMFVHNNEEQSVEVEESPFIDFSRVIEHLDEGNSIFIAPKYIKTIK